MFEDASGRIIISSYAQNVFRTKEIVELTKSIIVRLSSMDVINMTRQIVLFVLERTTHKPVITVPSKYLGKKENVGIP